MVPFVFFRLDRAYEQGSFFLFFGLTYFSAGISRTNHRFVSITKKPRLQQDSGAKVIKQKDLYIFLFSKF